MGDPTKLVLGELINDVLSEGRILKELAGQDLTGHLLEATVFFVGEPVPRFKASGIIEHIGIDTRRENGAVVPVQALISFRGQAAGAEKATLLQLGIGICGAEDYLSGHRVEINIYKNQGE